MKQKTLLVLLMALSLSVGATAQTSKLASKSASVKMQPAVEEALNGTVNPRYMVLKYVTAVYRQPADTLDSRRAIKLFPGTRIYLRGPMPNGMRIDLGIVAGEQYYVPAKSLRGLQTIVEI